jgi:hypothetical protein
MLDAELVEGLLVRGLTPSYSVRLLDPGARLIPVIRAIRELTGWGLGVARDATYRPTIIVERAPAELAEHAATVLREAGGDVDVGPTEACRYAFDPEHPDRGDQEVERIRIVGLGLDAQRSQLGDWEQSEPPRSSSVAALLAAIDERRAAWAAAGLREADSELEILEQVRARDPAAEGRIRERDDDERQAETAVYADWLQSVGDARGQLAAAAGDELTRLVDLHEVHLFGGNPVLLRGAEIEWLGPVIDALTLREGLADASAADLKQLLATPACACLRSLKLECAKILGIPIGEIVGNSDCAPGLRRLELRCWNALILRGDQFERLEALLVQHPFMMLGPMRLPALRELDIALSLHADPFTTSFVDLDTPKLDRFALFVEPDDEWEEHFGPLHRSLFELLSRPSFARLRSLVLGMADESYRPLAAGLAELLARLPCVATLEHIDLREAWLSDECRAELEHSRARLPPLLLPE